MATAVEILHDVLALEHDPRFLYNGMRLCYWCGNADVGAFPQSHAEDCPWAAAREWAKKHRPKKRRPPSEDGRAALFGETTVSSSLAPTPYRVDDRTPVFAGRSAQGVVEPSEQFL